MLHAERQNCINNCESNVNFKIQDTKTAIINLYVYITQVWTHFVLLSCL